MKLQIHGNKSAPTAKVISAQASDDTGLPTMVFPFLQRDLPARGADIDVFVLRVPHQSQAISLAKNWLQRDRKPLIRRLALGENFIAQARGGDRSLCKCYCYSEQPCMTESFQALELNLLRLQCRQLILTHLGVELIAHRHEWAGEAAADRIMIEI